MSKDQKCPKPGPCESESAIEMALEIRDPAKWLALQMVKAGRDYKNTGEAMDAIEATARKAIELATADLRRQLAQRDETIKGLRTVIRNAIPVLEVAAKKDPGCLGMVAPPVDGCGIPECRPWAVIDEMLDRFLAAARAMDEAEKGRKK